MKIINKDNKIYAALGWYGVVLAVAFVLINVGTLLEINHFAEKYDVDEIKYGYFLNTEYDNYPNADPLGGSGERIDYDPSIVKFYRDGEDVVITEELYYEFSDMSTQLISYQQSYLLLCTLLLVGSTLSLMGALQTRQFAHAHILGAMIFFIVILLDVRFVLNWVYSPVVLILIMTYIYLIARTRFCDYDESLLTGIFKK
jgi:hypothetical protein